MSLDVLKANRIAGSVTIEPNETIYDPVSKMRVSTPSNLIDTDFEYGLQSSKWETLELINNIPTFFSRDGSPSLSILTMSGVTGSNTITVTTAEEHGLVVGNSIIVKGANLAFADGTYVVITTPTPSSFTYRARRTSPITGSLREDATEIYLASLYQGTEFKLESLGAIATDGASPSTITVTTNGPHGFAVGTTFILLNSLTSQQITFDSTLVTPLIYGELQSVIRTDQQVTPDNNDSAYKVYPTFGTAGVTDTGILGMTLIYDGDAATTNLGTDNVVVRILFPEATPFKLFDSAYDRVWVTDNGTIFFTNDPALTGAGPLVPVNANDINDDFWAFIYGYRPLIKTLDADFRVKKIYYSNTTTGIRIRWEGVENVDTSTNTTTIWELTLDCENDTFDFRLLKSDWISLDPAGTNFRVISQAGTTPYQVAVSALFDPQNFWRRQIFIRTNYSDESVSSANGYNANSLDLDNTSKFNPYTWTAEKFSTNITGQSRPTLFFSLGKNAADWWEQQGINDTNYIESVRANVIKFNQDHFLVDNKPYLYNMGILNGGLTIGGSQITTPTVYYVRTKPGFYNGNTTTGTATLNQTGSTTSFSISGNTLTVNATVTGTAFDVGAYLSDSNGYVPTGTYITARGTGTGGTGTYTINRPLTVPVISGNTLSAARNIVTVAATGNMTPGMAIRFIPGTAVTPFLSTHVQGPTVSLGHLTVGQQYTIAALGTTTQLQWNTIAGTSGITYAVGSTFTAATNGAASGTGTANGSLAGILGNTTYYVKDVLSATQITISDQPTTDVNDSSTTPFAFTNPVAMGTATVATFTVQIGTVITDSAKQCVLVTQANRRTALTVNFGVQAPAGRFPLATDRFGPHSFMAAARVHGYETVTGTNFVQCLEPPNAAFLEGQPLAVWTTAIGGTTAFTNNWTQSQMSSVVYVRNPNSDTHQSQSTLPFGATNGTNTAPGNANFSSLSGPNGEVDGAIATVAAAAQDATTLSMTFDEGGFTTITSTSGNNITVTSTTGFKVGQIFGVDWFIGNLSPFSTYYVLTVGAGVLTVSETRGGAAFAVGTTTAQRMPCFAYGPLPLTKTNVMESYLGAINVTTFATNTTAGSNTLTLTTTSGLGINQPFSIAATIGNVISGTTYFVKTIESSTDITLSATQGGPTLSLTTGSNAGTVLTAQPLRNTPKGHQVILRNNNPIYQAYEVSPFGEFPGSTTNPVGFVTSHTGTTTRTLSIKLKNPLNNAFTIQTNLVGFDLLGSTSADILTFNLSTTLSGSNLTLTGTSVDGYVVPINYTQPWSTARSWYSKNHGYQNGDLIFWEASGGTQAASVPTGLTNKSYFIVDGVSPDRFKLLNDAGAVLPVTGAQGSNLDTTNIYIDKTLVEANTTRDTVYWNWRIAAAAAGATSTTITFLAPSWSGTGNIVVPTITAGANTFTITSAARLTGGGTLGNIAHHGGRVEFFDQFNQPLKMGTPWGPNTAYSLNAKVHYGNNLYNVSVAGTTAQSSPPSHTSGAVTDGTAELTYIGDARFNAYDIRAGAVTGTAPAMSVVCWVMNPGGLPGTFATTSTNKIVVDTGIAIRDEDNVTLGTNWLQSSSVFDQGRDNSYFPFVGSQIVDFYEHTKIPSTTLKRGSVTAVSPGETNSITYTFPANTVNIASIRRDNNVATVTTAVPHGFKEGTQVAIASVTDATFNNATAVILNATFNTFTYANSGTNAAVSTNGTASQLLPVITQQILAITAFTSNSTAVATTAAHGVTVGTVVPIHFQGFANAASPWYALWDNKVYYAKAATTTTLEIYSDANATIPLNTASFAAYNNGTDVGRIYFLGAKLSFAGNAHYFTRRASNPNGDTIFKAAHGLNNGTSVTYATGGGTEIGGLSGGSTKFVVNATTDRFQLADTASGWDTAAISFTQNTTNLATATGIITTGTHGFTTGRVVQYLSATPATGLTNGAFYYVRADSPTTCTLYWTLNGALNNVTDDRVKFVGTPTGTGSLRQSTVVDITAEGTGTAHTLTTGVVTGAIDGLYSVADAAPGGNTSKFTLNNPTNAVVPKRSLGINPQLNVDLYWNAIYSVGHKLVTGTPVVYTTSGTAIGPLVTDTTYYIIKLTDDWFRLASTVNNAVGVNPVAINLNSGNFLGSGTHQFEAASVVGSIVGAGSIVLGSGTTRVTGNGTNFSTAFKSGDNFYWNYPAVFTAKTTTFVSSTFTSTSHAMLTGMSVRWNSTVAAPTGLTNGAIYYVRYSSANDFNLAPTYNDAVAGTNLIVASGGSGTHTVSLIEPGNTGVSTIASVNSRTVLNLTDTIPITEQYRIPVTLVSLTSGSADITITFPMPCPFPANSVVVLTGTGNTTQIDNIPLVVKTNTGSNSTSIVVTMQTNAAATLTYPATTTASTVHGIFIHGFPATNTYDVTSSLLLRADSTALHRPFDGGVELIATDSPNARAIRQTRRYFRYQSGKGIQVSFAINFSPSVPADYIISDGGNTSTIQTRVPHRCTAGLNITITGDSSGNYNNQSFGIQEIIDDYKFRIATGYNRGNATGRPQFYVNSWSDAVIRCGLMDDQNGMFFEYDGSTLYVCRRSSTVQLGGRASVIFNSNQIVATDSSYTSELSAGDYVVIRGQSYKVIEVPNNNTFYIQPSYRGATSGNVVVSRTTTLRIPQSQWNLDPCNGNGPTGYNLNKYAIQMAYMDYSWYGAGKVRFGFKDTEGVVRYVHQIVHNNFESEAYLRSGNLPARYEVETGVSPSFIPKLAHWGTSVIMDGGFDDDKAYLFSATSNQIRTSTGTSGTISVTGGTQASVSLTFTADQLIVGRSYTINTTGTTNWTLYGAANSNVGTSFVATSAAVGNQGAFAGTVFALDKWYAYNNGGKLIGEIGFAIEIPTHLDAYFAIGANSAISGSGLVPGTLTSIPTNSLVGNQPYVRGVRVSPTSNITKNLLVINTRPSSIQGTGTTYTVTQAVDLTRTIPLLSLRLAPSADNGIPGALGQREVINRMQLALQKLDVLSTHEVELSLVLNADLDNLDWKRVTSPSLSQVVYHNISDTIDQGSVIFSFRVPPGNQLTTPNNRGQALTSIDLREIATLGNSILGGNGVFPDGPDVLTLRLRYIGLASDVTTNATFVASCRLSWTESQA